MSGTMTDTREAEANRLMDEIALAAANLGQFNRNHVVINESRGRLASARAALLRLILGEPTPPHQPGASVPTELGADEQPVWRPESAQAALGTR